MSDHNFPMKVLHVPFTYFPDRSGGTEVYVAALARGMAEYSIESIVAAQGNADQAYFHDGIAVDRFALGKAPTLRDSYGAGDPIAAEKFEAILGRRQPDVVHLHAFTMGASLLFAQAARRQGIPVVFTYHTPTASCVRGTMMHEGRRPCDGVMQMTRCARCALEARGAGRASSRLLGSIPPAIGTWIGATGRTGPLWTALRYTELTELRHAAFRELLRLAERIIVPCIWAGDVLRRNGVDESKLLLSRQGLAQQDVEGLVVSSVRQERPVTKTVRLAFLGRFSEEKGVHVLLDALRSIPTARVSLDLYGSAQGSDGERYMAYLHRLAEGDSRVRFVPPVPSDLVIRTLREYDALLVPSQWMETGPLVVLEAFAARIPVIGSDIGGIAELVRHNVDGLLVSPNSILEWAETLQGVATDRELLTQLGRGIIPPRRMDAVAAEMAGLYRTIRFRPTSFSGSLEGSVA